MRTIFIRKISLGDFDIFVNDFVIMILKIVDKERLVSLQWLLSVQRIM